jgi:hypothetical protein
MELSGGECGWRSLSIASGGRVPVRFILTRLVRSSSRLRLSSSQRRGIEQAGSTEVEEWVDSGRKTPCILKRARWEGVVKYWHVRR